MKYILMILLSLSVVACATSRAPSSTTNQPVEHDNLDQGVNADYYAPRF